MHIACAGVSVTQITEMKKSGEIKRWKCGGDCGKSDAGSGLPGAGGTGLGGASGVVSSAPDGNPDGKVRTTSLPSETGLSPCGRCNALFGCFSRALEEMERRMASEMMAFRTQMMREFQSMLTTSFEDMRKIVVNSVVPAAGDTSTKDKKSFAEAVSDTCSFLVRPVDTNQSVTLTKTDLFQKINPVENKLSLARVKEIKNGGLLVNCSDASESSKFKTMAADKLAADYTIKEVVSLLPRIKLVGLSEKLEEKEFVNCLRVQNEGTITTASTVKFVSCTALRNRKDIYQVVVQVDRGTYQRALATGRLFVGYDNCVVYDAIEVKRCYNCSGLNHMSRGCRLKPVCPRCSEEHSIKDCQSDNMKCANCIKHNEKFSGSCDVNHAAWDNDCPCYSRVLASIRSEILGVK